VECETLRAIRQDPPGAPSGRLSSTHTDMCEQSNEK
jgi:hypothetical protein